jgi:UDP-GlcNAc3NAcA epimerase
LPLDMGIHLKELRIVSIVGARPQFIKAAMINRAIQSHRRKNSKVMNILVHTGQHYDYNMSQIFFDQMKIPAPQYHLGVGSGTHAMVTGRMLAKVEKILMKERPDWVIVYGDTNSTLAGAFAAAKLPLPIAHVEAGLRSFNRHMPEEINRVLTDHISSILFCPTDAAVKNLRREGITRGVFKVGDVMYDAYLLYKDLALTESDILKKLKLSPGSYCLATVHRQENTDDLLRLSNIFQAFDELAKKDCPFIVPLHPRTQKKINKQKSRYIKNPHIRLTNPVSYLDMLALESQAHIILTDSGGIQKEALFARVPCITMREETEWIETVQVGMNYLSGANTEMILSSFKRAENAQVEMKNFSDFYGNGNASKLVLDSLLSLSPFDLKTIRPSFSNMTGFGKARPKRR